MWPILKKVHFVSEKICILRKICIPYFSGVLFCGHLLNPVNICNFYLLGFVVHIFIERSYLEMTMQH